MTINTEQIEEISKSLGLYITTRYGGIVFASKLLRKHFNKKYFVDSYKEDGLEVITDKKPSLEIQLLLDEGYRVLHANGTVAHYYSTDGN